MSWHVQKPAKTMQCALPFHGGVFRMRSPMPETDIVFALTGDVRRNSRALRQLRALVAMGVSVDVLTLSEPGGEGVPDVQSHMLPRPTARGPRFFLRVHRLFAAAAMKLRARVYHASDLYVLPAMRAAARRHGARLIFDARELYTRVASTTSRPWSRAVWRLIEGRHIVHADAVFTVSESIARHLARMYGIPPPVVVHNVPEMQHIEASPLLRGDLDPETTLLLHQGQIQKDRGCFLLARAMQEVEHAVLVFLGGGPLKKALEEYVRGNGLEARVRFEEPVAPDRLLRVTAGADVGITLLENTCLNHRFALPNKLFEYLMAGLPVVASNLPEIRGVVQSFDVGCIVDPADHSQLVQVLQHVTRDRKARKKWAANAATAIETFSWEKASRRFTDVYSRLLRS